MQFKIPQDVQRADRIVGPLTMRQLVIVGIGGGIGYSLYIVLAKQYFIEIWLPPVIFMALVTLAFAFYQFHDVPFEKFVLYFIEYKFKPQKRTFQKTRGDVAISVLHQMAPHKQKADYKTKEAIDLEKFKNLSALTARVDTHSKELLMKKVEELRQTPADKLTSQKL